MNCPYCDTELTYLGFDVITNEDNLGCSECGIIDTAEGWEIVGAIQEDDEN